MGVLNTTRSLTEVSFLESIVFPPSMAAGYIHVRTGLVMPEDQFTDTAPQRHLFIAPQAQALLAMPLSELLAQLQATAGTVSLRDVLRAFADRVIAESAAP